MFVHKYDSIITIEGLLSAWQCFIRRKRYKRDVVEFQFRLAENLADLYASLSSRTYEHGQYMSFNVSDPKPRIIHKAAVRDRVLHRLIYQEIYDHFDDRFIFDSFSCRKGKGTHRALNRFKLFAGRVTMNNTRTCYVLKCDVKKFFASIDQEILMKILARHILDQGILWLIGKVVSSFCSSRSGVGLPLGNLTSQLLANIYMHEFDIYIKQELLVKHFIRYADDFVILSGDRKYLEDLLPRIDTYLRDRLHLTLHETKVHISTLAAGVDFLGWVHFPYYRTIRTSTRRKVFLKLKWYPRRETVISYRGLLSHGNTYRIQKRLGFVTF